MEIFYTFTDFKRECEYNLIIDNYRYFLNRKYGKSFQYQKYSRSKISKRLRNILNNIQKLKGGRIKKYFIFNKLELEIVSEFLRKNNILHLISINSNESLIYNHKYEEYKIDEHQMKSFFSNTQDDLLEYQKIKNPYTLNITVYKDFFDLNSVSICNKNKHEIYINHRYINPFVRVRTFIRVKSNN